MEKIRYELDPYNRLVLNKSGKKSGLHRFRKVLDGKFHVDPSNNLSYHVKAPLSDDYQIPRQVKLDGEWSLTDNHELRLTLDTASRETFGDQITLKGDIIDVAAYSIFFALTTSSKDNARSTYVLNLGGVWKADEHNRISFHVKKEGGRYDILSFAGAWEIDRNNQIIYEYEKAKLLRKKRETHKLTFKGCWDITDKARISYMLGQNSDSVLNFNASVGIFTEKYIKYEVGIGVINRAKENVRIVKLSGRWFLKKGSGLVFEVTYENGRVGDMVFGFDANIASKNIIAFRLRKDADSKDLGATLELSRKLLKGDGEIFLRALASQKESGIYTGAAWRF